MRLPPPSGLGEGLAAGASAHYLRAMPLPRPASTDLPVARPACLLEGPSDPSMGGGHARLDDSDRDPRRLLPRFLHQLPGLRETITFIEAGPPTAPTRRSTPSRRPTCKATRAFQAERQRQFKQIDDRLRAAGHLSDARWMGAAIALAERGRGRTAPNPNVGCVIVRDGELVGRGWTQPGGRPHAEAVALGAGRRARARRDRLCHARTLRACQRTRPRLRRPADRRGGLARVVIALVDPDPRTDGRGIERLRAAGIEVERASAPKRPARRWPGFLTRQRLGRPLSR